MKSDSINSLKSKKSLKKICSNPKQDSHTSTSLNYN